MFNSKTEAIIEGLKEPTWKTGCSNCKELKSRNEKLEQVLYWVEKMAPLNCFCNVRIFHTCPARELNKIIQAADAPEKGR